MNLLRKIGHAKRAVLTGTLCLCGAGGLSGAALAGHVLVSAPAADSQTATKGCVNAQQTRGATGRGLQRDTDACGAKNPQTPPTLTVTTNVLPSGDTGKFSLKIDGVILASAVGNGGSTGAVTLSVGQHTVGEVYAGPGGTVTSLSYLHMRTGVCAASTTFTLAAGQNATCTFINTKSGVHSATAIQFPHQVAFQYVQPGSWTKRNGIYYFTVCSSSPCNLVADPGQSVLVKIEAWSAGGGGGGGYSEGGSGGNGGNGGGGGGYATTTINVTVPASGSLTYYIQVGASGHAGHEAANYYTIGGQGGSTEVRMNSSSGTTVLTTVGGQGGDHYDIDGVGGTGSINGWSGTHGYAGGKNTSGNCNGKAGGLGGAGGGPGRTGPGYINDGGDGGHGGYHNNHLNCTAQDNNGSKTDGGGGGDGQIKFSW